MRANTPLFSLKRSHIRGFLCLIAVSLVFSILRRISQRTVILVLLFFLLLSLTFTVFLPQKSQQNQSHAAGAARGFVTRSGSQLLLNGQPFRFAGADIHWLGLDDGANYPSTTRVNNVFSDAHSMHATMIRSHTLGISVGCAKCIEPSLNQFNDAAFVPIDYAIKTAAANNIHLIIPLTDNWHFYHGGKHTFTDWRGDPNEDDFYTNPTVIQDFQNYIAHILNHVNQYTGIALKDDPTIMAWETGNELYTATDTWTEMIAQYIKSIAPDQLVSDGKPYGNTPSRIGEFSNPSTDMITDHDYPPHIAEIQNDANTAKQHNKAFFIGEWDWTGTNVNSDPLPTVLSGIENNTAVSGSTYWQLYDNGYHGDKFTLHYPGDTTDMQARVQMLSDHAARMSSAATTPAQPTITPMSTTTPTDATTPTPTGATTPTPTLTSNLQAVTSFTLINAQKNTVLQPITDGAIIDLSKVPTRCLNIRATTNPATVGSVLFGYDRKTTYHIENYAPYDLGNDYGHGDNPMCWTLTTGSHTLTATPYGSTKAKGAHGTPLTVHFIVIAHHS